MSHSHALDGKSVDRATSNERDKWHDTTINNSSLYCIDWVAAWFCQTVRERNICRTRRMYVLCNSNLVKMSIQCLTWSESISLQQIHKHTPTIDRVFFRFRINWSNPFSFQSHWHFSLFRIHLKCRVKLHFIARFNELDCRLQKSKRKEISFHESHGRVAITR